MIVARRRTLEHKRVKPRQRSGPALIVGGRIQVASRLLVLATARLCADHIASLAAVGADNRARILRPDGASGRLSMGVIVMAESRLATGASVDGSADSGVPQGPYRGRDARFSAGPTPTGGEQGAAGEANMSSFQV